VLIIVTPTPHLGGNFEKGESVQKKVRKRKEKEKTENICRKGITKG
jgi:hypothetical protein